ncbi:tRNA (adenosine(37)-N6)-threonylcarbamoyltransferase complex dimerization subunit type 1 TsaB [bacterium]|nr:MAG: tRNA (adenosine(37)-N6)-threonylcarbamoyltransferase complex dimerization subunit type 1 TsaB [bacterium]
MEIKKIYGVYRSMSENLILAIESSGINSGIAIGNQADLIYESSLYKKHSHDETLAHQIRETLEFLNLKVEDLDAVAISSGPGSFTGLRVGSAIAKGLTFGEHPKLIDVPTLSAFATVATEFAQILNVESIFALIPSNLDKYYIQEFESNAIPKSEPTLLHKDEILKLNLANNVVCGTGATDFNLNNYQLSGLNRLTPRFILKFAQINFANQKFVKSEDFKPRYYQEFTPAQKKEK